MQELICVYQTWWCVRVSLGLCVVGYVIVFSCHVLYWLGEVCSVWVTPTIALGL